MRSRRFVFTCFTLCLALLSVFVVYPSEARAEWVQIQSSKLGYVIDSTLVPSHFKVSPIQTGLGTSGFNTIINPKMRYWYVLGDTQRWEGGRVWNTLPSTTDSVLVRYAAVDGGQLAKGQRVHIMDASTLTVWYTNVTQPTVDNWTYYYASGYSYRYFVSDTNNENTTEVFANENGVFVMPFDAQYFFVVCRIEGVTSRIPNAKFWYVDSAIQVNIERPEDQNEVAAINDQTTQLKDTTGSDTVTSDVVGQNTQKIENLSLWQSIQGITSQLQQALTTTESDTTVVFPGVNLLGFVMPSYEIDPLAVSPIDPNIIRGFVTFIFVCWYIAYMRNLLSNIFDLRWYNYDGEIYDEGTVTGRDNPNGNWGLVE